LYCASNHNSGREKERKDEGPLINSESPFLAQRQQAAKAYFVYCNQSPTTHATHPSILRHVDESAQTALNSHPPLVLPSLFSLVSSFLLTVISFATRAVGRACVRMVVVCMVVCLEKKKKKKSERVGRSAKCGAVAAGACIHPYIYNAMDASMCFLLVLPLLPPPPFHLFVNGRQLLLFPGLCLNCIVVFGQGECLLATQPFTFFNPDLHELDLCRLAKL